MPRKTRVESMIAPCTGPLSVMIFVPSSPAPLLLLLALLLLVAAAAPPVPVLSSPPQPAARRRGMIQARVLFLSMVPRTTASGPPQPWVARRHGRASLHRAW